MKRYNQFNSLLFAIVTYLSSPVIANAQPICFSQPSVHFTGSGDGIYGAVADDFNNDGLIDLVTSNSTGNNISMMLGDGNGSFGLPVDYETGLVASGMNKGDFNNDGDLDVVVTNQANGYISVLLGNGDGTFNNAINIPIVFGQPYSVICHDFDNDSILDLVVGCYSGALVIMIGDGTGNFSTLNTYYGSGWNSSITLADFNNDGILDLVVPGGFAYNIIFFQGLGGGNFAMPFSLPCSEEPFYLMASDLNSDSLPDIITANWNDTCVTIFFNTGNFSFAAPVYYLFQGPIWASPGTVDLVDFNNDSIFDLLVSFGNLNGISVLPGTGNGNFSNEQHFSGTNGAVLAIAVDLNQDGKTDIIDPSQHSPAYCVLLNCTPVGVAEASIQNNNVKIYPTIVSDNLTIEISSSSPEKKYMSIYNTLGEEILKENFSL